MGTLACEFARVGEVIIQNEQNPRSDQRNLWMFGRNVSIQSAAKLTR